MIRLIKILIPSSIFKLFQPIYHFLLALLGALIYKFPSRGLFVIGVTGTKGKTSTTELINKILETAGKKTALSNTIRFKIANKTTPNMHKMSMPGRLFMQKFLREALRNGCTHAVVEITSEGAKQFRHKWIDLDVLIFTNLSPEHIEAHGSYEKYRDSKLSIGKEFERNPKKEKWIIANADDKESPKFLALNATHKISYALKNIEPYVVTEDRINLTFDGLTMSSPLAGLFNAYNILAAATCAKAIGISIETIKIAVSKLALIRGRVEKVEAGQDFTVIVDYAHTADSLEKLYQAFPNKRKICVLGNTGGGRDKWKRPEMARVAEKYCDQIILTNEDPYDEDPRSIVEEMKKAASKKPCEIIMDRRKAMARSFSLARPGDVVLITGKGTDPYIMEAKGKKLPWSDGKVAREELEELLRMDSPEVEPR